MIQANVLYSIALQKRFTDTNSSIRAISLHPGNVETELTRGPAVSFPILGALMARLSVLAMTPEQGALTQLYAATSPEIDEMVGDIYLVPIATRCSTSKDGADRELAEQLWTLSEKIVQEAQARL